MAMTLCRTLLISLACLLNSFACQAADQRFTVVSVDTTREKLELFLGDESGTAFKRFDRLASWLKARNRQLRIAMNAGMYRADFSPVGLLVMDGKQVSALNLEDGAGNFFLKPNGVFLLKASGPRVVESAEYPALAKGVRLATQSGPLLLRNGVMHPAFHATSSSRLIRNGVGVVGNTVFLVISNLPVTFHEFATFFRDDLHCQDALYLDGVVSGLYSTELHRNDTRAELGPMLGVVE